MDCREVERFSELSLDGEIDPEAKAELDIHLTECPSCRGGYESRRAYHSGLKGKLRTASGEHRAPQGLQTRITRKIHTPATEATGWGRPVAAALAVASIAVLSWSFSSDRSLVPEETAARHSKNLPPEVRASNGKARVHRFLKRNLGFPVQVPQFRRPHVRMVGARLSPIEDRPAAYVMYDDRGARISLFAYPRGDRRAKPRDFEERLVDGRSVFVGRHRGYNVVAWEQEDLVYSLVSEVDPTELIELISSEERPRATTAGWHKR